MNKLTVVLDKLIYKRYGTTDSCTKEYYAWKQFNELVPENTATLVLKKEDLCVYEYLEQENRKVTKQNASLFAAQVITNIYNCYDPFVYKKGDLWKLAVKNLIEEFNKTKPQLDNRVNKEFTTMLQNNLKIIEDSEFTTISFLHRDIHKGNIIYENGHPYLIDHEHAMEGPIELELQNSLFWNDRMSLNTKLVKKYLISSGIKYSEKNEQLLRNFYVADQLVLAIKDNKLTKVDKLVRKAIATLR